MHTAQRIDRQFIGRSGRQGDPGSSQSFVSFEDELIRHHTPRLGTWLKTRSNNDELTGQELAGARKLFRLAQRQAEGRSRRSRAQVMRQDDWIDQHLPGG